jgi:hypothetical protein
MGAAVVSIMGVSSMSLLSSSSISLRVASLGGSKRAESLQVEVAQNDCRMLAASAWMIDDALSRYVHDFAAAPAMPRPDALRGCSRVAAASRTCRSQSRGASAARGFSSAPGGSRRPLQLAG